MFAGCGRSEIAFPKDFFPTEGFTVQAHPLYVRALVLGREQPVAVVSIEMTSLPDEEAAKLKAVAAQAARTEEQNVWIAVTHTFSAPHIMPDHALKTDAERARKAALKKLLADAVRGAVERAAERAGECEMTISRGQSGIPASRDIELAEGWWVGCGGKGPSDNTLTVLKLSTAEGVKGLLVHLNVQPSVLDGTGAADGRCVSGDLAGVACAALEAAYPGAAAMFMVGAAGDQAPVKRAVGYVPAADGGYAQIDLHEEGVPIAEALGRQLADEVQDALARDGEVVEGAAEIRVRAFDVPAKKMNRNLRELKPTRSCEWEPDGLKAQTIELLTVGGLAILGVKPELTAVTAAHILAVSPYRHTLVATMVNGGAKYMADRSAYDRRMYEAINSPFMPGAAEKLEMEARKLFER